MEPAVGAHPEGRGDAGPVDARPPAILYRPIGSSALDGVSGLRSVVRALDADGRLLLDDDVRATTADVGRLDTEVVLDVGRRLGEWAELADGLVVWAHVAAVSGLGPIEAAIETALRSVGGRRHRLGLGVPVRLLQDPVEAERARALRSAGVGILARDVGRDGSPDIDPTELGADLASLHPDLVRGVVDDPGARARLGDLLGRCARAGLPTIASGVDHLGLLEVLEDMGVDQVEGALAGQPEQPLVIGMLLSQVGVRAPELRT